MSGSVQRNPAELRKHYADIRSEVRKQLRKLDRAQALVMEVFNATVIKGNRVRHDWGFVLEIMREKRDRLDLMLLSYRVRKRKPKPATTEVTT